MRKTKKLNKRLEIKVITLRRLDAEKVTGGGRNNTTTDRCPPPTCFCGDYSN
jgi:hypothetical protein